MSRKQDYDWDQISEWRTSLKLSYKSGAEHLPFRQLVTIMVRQQKRKLKQDKNVIQKGLEVGFHLN